ncbi:MAG: hypothetical protein MJY87_01620 [Fibrobacter sp.]|nr:hypothetical protein [Fibrobacter sp.]
MKRVSTTLAVVLGAFAFSSAAQIQGFFSGYAPTIVDEYKEVKGKEIYSELNSDFMWGLGAEFLANPVGPLVVGGGLGFFSLQQDGDVYVVMPSIPLWASVGVVGPEQWTVRPYLEFRAGYPIPATGLSTWWDKPLNFFVTGSIGVQLPYHMGVEFDYTYISMDKYFKDYDVNFRLASAKFGGSITIHFDLSGSSSEPAAVPARKADVVKPAEEFSSEASSDMSENVESAPAEEHTYGDYSEQPAEEPEVQESVAEPVTEYGSEESSDEQAVEETAESGAEEENSSAEESVAEESSAEEAPAEETVAEESVAEETPAEETAEPAVEPEPKPEPAAAPEPKPEPAAKKAGSKKSAKNAKAKKGSKKDKKKAGAKKSTKKGKAASKKTAKKPAAKKKAAAKKKVES